MGTWQRVASDRSQFPADGRYALISVRWDDAWSVSTDVPLRPDLYEVQRSKFAPVDAGTPDSMRESVRAWARKTGATLHAIRCLFEFDDGKQST